MNVYLLWHSYENADGTSEDKLIGVYSSEANANTALDSARQLPGFRDHPNGFLIDPYVLDKDYWADGFVRI